MKVNIKYYLGNLIALALFVSVGCNKLDTLETNFLLGGVKTYDDSLASIEHPSIKISSAADRIYMTYGIGKGYGWEVINNFIYEIRGSYVKINALDSEGTLLWQKSLPEDILLQDILALDDGGCIAACSKIFSSPYMFFYRFDRNGNEILNDSLLLLQSTDYNFVDYGQVNLMHAANGNILVYGWCYDLGYASTFSCEYDNNINPLWEKVYTSGEGSFLNGCVLTPDGGYLFAGSAIDQSTPVATANVKLIKTNASGDAIWIKHYSPKDNIACTGFTPMSNGNYCLSFYTSISNGQPNPGYTDQTYLMEVNAAGDSLNASRIDISKQIYNAALIGSENGSLFALMNSYKLPPYATISWSQWDQKNSSSVILDNTLTSNSGGFLQTETNDYFGDVCKTTDGRMVCAGLIQSYGQYYFKPCILFY